MRLMSALAGLAFSIAMTGCQTPSSDLQHYRVLDGQAQMAYAQGLPLERRLDLYRSLYSVRRHPSDSSLSLVFRGSGESGFHAALARMVTRNDFYAYVWVLKAVDAGGDIDLCQPSYLDQIHERARMANLGHSDLTFISFRRCALADGLSG